MSSTKLAIAGGVAAAAVAVVLVAARRRRDGSLPRDLCDEYDLHPTLGFMPDEVATRLPKPFAAWDRLAASLPALNHSGQLRAAVDAMPTIPVCGRVACPCRSCGVRYSFSPIWSTPISTARQCHGIACTALRVVRMARGAPLSNLSMLRRACPH